MLSLSRQSVQSRCSGFNRRGVSALYRNEKRNMQYGKRNMQYRKRAGYANGAKFASSSLPRIAVASLSRRLIDTHVGGQWYTVGFSVSSDFDTSARACSHLLDAFGLQIECLALCFQDAACRWTWTLLSTQATLRDA